MALHSIFVSPLQPFSVRTNLACSSALPSLTTAVVTVALSHSLLHSALHCAMAGTGPSGSGGSGAFGTGSSAAMSVEGTTVAQVLSAVGQQLQWIAVEVGSKPELFPLESPDYTELERIAVTVEQWKTCLEVKRAPPAAFRHILVSLLHGMVR